MPKANNEQLIIERDSLTVHEPSTPIGLLF